MIYLMLLFYLNMKLVFVSIIVKEKLSEGEKN